MRTILLLFIFSVALNSNFVYGQVYKWVDERGGIHFTDDFTLIPEKYRAKALEERDLPRSSPSSKVEQESKKGSPSSAPLDVRKEEHTDSLGRGERYWRDLVETWKKKLNESQEKLEALRLRYNELTERFNSSRSSVERAQLRKERDDLKNEMDRQRAQIEEARLMLEKKIPEEAEIFRARPEWVRH